jgi:ABC-type Fe3+/spermidine/putrescine transport system ATPase subunit
MALLSIEGVTRRLENLAAVDNVTLAVEAGEFFTCLDRPAAARRRCCG